MVRRAVALVVLVAFIAVVVALVRAVLDDGPSTRAAPDTIAPATSVNIVERTPGGATSVVTTTTVLPKEPFVPSADHRAVVLIVGDSDAGTFGPYLQRLLKTTGIVETDLHYKASTGLARPDYFNWPATLAEDLVTYRPDIVVMTFGGNDAQGLLDPAGKVLAGVPSGEAGGDERWRAEYGRRVAEMVEMASVDGTKVIWVGIPNHVSEDVTRRMRVQDETVRAQLATHPDVAFVDTWKLFSGGNGNYAAWVIDPRDGEGKSVRAKDGFHLNETGAEILALKVYDQVVAELRARGATVDSGVDAAKK